MCWLISTAWNRGCRHAKFLRNAQALPFMTATLALMDHYEEYKDRKEVKNLPCYTIVLREACLESYEIGAHCNEVKLWKGLRHHSCCKEVGLRWDGGCLAPPAGASDSL